MGSRRSPAGGPPTGGIRHVVKSGVPDLTDSLRPLGSSHSSCRPRAGNVATRRLAYDEAARLLRPASATAQLGPATLQHRAEIELELATAEFNAGFVVRATESVRHAIALASRPAPPRSRRRPPSSSPGSARLARRGSGRMKRSLKQALSVSGLGLQRSPLWMPAWWLTPRRYPREN